MTLEISDDLRDRIRGRFPALAGETVFLESAGGSQVPRSVVDRMRDYMLGSYVQLGAGYPLSQRATATVEEARGFVKLVFGGVDGEVVLGPSTSALLQMLAGCYAKVFGPGSEVVVARSGHEANVGPWVRLERAGVRVRWWEVDPRSFDSPIDALARLLSDRTALVAFPHVSTLLGGVADVAPITELAHAAGARVVVDGVAYAPHRAMDVTSWGVDWYAFSTYKVYGPHMAALWGRREAMAGLEGPNHFFVAADDVPYKLELGGVNHEACAGLLGVRDYLAFLADETEPDRLDRSGVGRAFDLMAACELPVQERLIEYLRSRPDVRIIGPAHSRESRVGTVSFVHRSRGSGEITDVVDYSGIAIRSGHMYAHRLCESLGLDPADGVVRISLVHYNTLEEIDRLIDVLQVALRN
jgi:cysteine desulfurase family protein (TIGR01976 family)